MAIADHIYIECDFIGVVPYTHHGIDCGDGTVIHYSDRCIRRDSIQEFSQGKKIYKEHYDDCDSPDIVILRAESRLGECEYKLFSNNCEHFASWCKTGFEEPKQMKPILGLLDFFNWRIQDAERQNFQKLLSKNNEIIEKLNSQLKQQEKAQLKSSQEQALITDKFDYRILQNLLQEGYWQEADELTLYAMLKISSRENDRYFRPTDISNFSREHLLIIDKLWQEYSSNLFGFTAQKEIYQNLGGNQNYQHEIWEKFSEKVGWRRNEVPLSYEQLTFSRNAVKGHLPHGKKIGSEVIGFLTII
ncbi:GUN4 domain-containing protein [Calothrix sp. NIES-2098]|uniref:GUN4 domain-containing protein n=1 Tax=Calothrix sp. NIES-2098 TaxID=1954171 RepID=UPI000B5FD655|nr:GUN4-like protein [Calothrix sp. NIES-2098]